MDRVEELSRAFERFPGIGPRQAKRFVYFLLSIPQGDRSNLSRLIEHIGEDVRQCAECMRFWTGTSPLCNYCSDRSRNDRQLMLVEKDQDLLALERANAYKGRYFVLGGALTLSGKGYIRERELVERVERKSKENLEEIILALSATSEGEHTSEHIRDLLGPLRGHIKLFELGRGLATGSELEYADTQTLSAAFANRKET
jgi:recombination protein RecR